MGVDQRQRHEGGDVGGLAVAFEGRRSIGHPSDVDDEQLQSSPDLLGGQADALSGVHRLEHVADKFLDVERDLFDPAASLTQSGMAVFHDG